MSEVPAVPRTSDLNRATDGAFSDDGPLARCLPGFEARAGQRAMATAVAETFETGGTLLAQAGTGTGKTLAYLVPAILSGRRVLISTGTKNLQEQVYFKDLPVLGRALGVPFTATYMKGRGNYLCLHRFESFRETALLQPTATRGYLELIDRWVPRTESGDRAELEDLPEDVPFWSDIAATSENCLGTDCPRYQDCFVTRMRQRAAESDIVIVNHHLLCADAAVRTSAYGEVIPECHFAIIDEAHQLEDVATQYFGVSVSTYRLDELVRDGERASSVLEPQCEDLGDALQRIRARGRAFFASLGMTVSRARGGSADDRRHQARADNSSESGGEDRVRVTPSILAGTAEAGLLLLGTLENLEATVALLKEAPEDVLALGRRAREIADELKFLIRASDPDYVYYVETRGRGTFLRASPIDVSTIVRERLLDRMHATVLTSATLAVDDSFEYVRGRLGVRGAEELNLAPEFDYARQAVLYLPKSMPDPRSPRFVEAAAREVIEILRRTDGRAFVLFTSYANLRAVQAIVQPLLEYPLFVQGTAPRSVLLAQFRSTSNSVLLGTSSFWQGVDVIGEALSCVIIDRLPFASPGDPITGARIEAIAARGEHPFAEYQVPLAILTLQQGLGRLIRHRTDRGVLAILDPRVRTMSYGRRFLDSLPPAPVTSDLGAIERFFA